MWVARGITAGWSQLTRELYCTCSTLSKDFVLPIEIAALLEIPKKSAIL